MNSKIRNTAFVGLMAAVVAVVSVWQIPLPFLGVPLTFQTFAVCLAGAALGRWRGTLSVFVYIALGSVGLPVFTGFQGGLGVLAGPTGGFIIGFLALAFLSGLAKGKRLHVSVLLSLLGLLLCHGLGGVYFAFVTGQGIFQSFLVCCAPYMIKDGALCFLAVLLARLLLKRRIV